MRWTIGMPSYNNLTEVFFTVQSLRMYHNLKDCEIVVVDNFGDPNLEKFCNKNGGGVVRYEKFTDITGCSAPKNRMFEIAKGENVLCIDSHIMIMPGMFEIDLPNDDLYQGPLMHSDCVNYACEWFPEWRGNMWGVWGPNTTKLPDKPFEIWAMGAGFLACKKGAWLGFNKEFRGFGGETGYIQEKYRKAGKKVWCDPRMVWMHLFGRKIPYPLATQDRINNYVIGFKELGLDTQPIYDHFRGRRETVQ
jgi:hypothetical protein